MKIHVFITYDIAEPAAVPGCVVRTVEFAGDIQAHRLVQLAQDTAEEVAVGYLRHVAEPQGAPPSLAREARASARLDGETHCLPDEGAPPKCQYHPIYRECSYCGGAMNRDDDLECPGQDTAKGAPQKPEG